GCARLRREARGQERAAGEDHGFGRRLTSTAIQHPMARPARIDLRLFQQELATRLASKTTAQVESSRLGLSCAGERWLIRLADAAAVVAGPPLAAVPLTQRWFLGLTNIRGNLYSVVDLAGFLGRETVVPHGTSGQSRLILF